MLASSQCLSIITPKGSVPTADINTGFDPRRARHSVDKKYKTTNSTAKQLNKNSTLTEKVKYEEEQEEEDPVSLKFRPMHVINEKTKAKFPMEYHVV